ncbi:MAG: tetratricopeptide repeat protein [Acidobacteriia bacterium]|nr:tetratricopeptide repeat protein [Terriglobia bacterium]
MRRVLVLAFIFVLAASLAWGADFNSLMSEGKAALESKDYSQAEKAFRAALGEQPDSADAELYLGITLSRKGDRSQYKEAESHLKRALMASPQDPTANYELGMLFYARAVPSEAEDFFDNVLQAAPGSELARKAKEQLRIIREQGAQAGVEAGEARKRWALALSTGVQYDSNVVLRGHDEHLPEGVDRQYDWRSIYTFAGAVNFIQTEPVTGSIGYSFYQNENTELASYDVSQARHRRGKGWVCCATAGKKRLVIGPLLNDLRARHIFAFPVFRPF